MAALLERGAELREAAEVLNAAGSGAGGGLLIEGPAGIGKSALIRAIRREAEGEGFAVLAARGAELEREFSFGVVRQLFEPALAARKGAERDALLAGAAHLAEPAIGELAPPDAADVSPSVDPSFAVLHGLYWLTANLAEHSPLLIAVDDAHWSDAASLRFLSYLAGRLEGLPVVLTVALRPFELGAASKLVAALDAEATTRVVHLPPLSAAGTDALVRARFQTEPAPGFATACHRASGGNPQLTQELLAALAAEGVEPTPAGAAHIADLRADRIAASVLARVEHLGDPAVALARSAAVLGRTVSVAEVSGGGSGASSNGSSSNSTNNNTATTTTTTTLTPPRVPGPTMALLGSRLRASRRGVIRLRLGCPAETPGGCSGTAGLQKGAAPRAFRAAAGATTTAKLKLTRSTRRRLSRRHRIRVTVAVTAHDGQGNEATSSGAYTVLSPRR